MRNRHFKTVGIVMDHNVKYARQARTFYWAMDEFGGPDFCANLC
jgi:hypothetical protein